MYKWKPNGYLAVFLTMSVVTLMGMQSHIIAPTVTVKVDGQKSLTLSEAKDVVVTMTATPADSARCEMLSPTLGGATPSIKMIIEAGHPWQPKVGEKVIFKFRCTWKNGSTVSDSAIVSRK